MTYYRKQAAKIPVYAWDKSTGDPKTGDAANITAQLSKDYGASAAIADTNPTELDATNQPGIYVFDVTATEMDADSVIVTPVSATSDILLDPVFVETQPKLFTLGSASGTPTTTSIPTDLTEATTDHFKGMFVVFTSGVCAGQSSKITAYDGATKTLTVEALTDAPASGDEFVILGGS